MGARAAAHAGVAAAARLDEPRSRYALVFAATVRTAPSPRVQRLVDVVDRRDGGRPTRPFSTRTCCAAAPWWGRPVWAARSRQQEVEDFVKLKVLLPRHRYQPKLGYRLVPVLDLLCVQSVRTELNSSGSICN